MLRLPIQKLKDHLISEGLITDVKFEESAKEAERLNQKLEDVLVSRGIVSGDYIYNFLSKYLGVELANLTNTAALDEEVLNLMTPDMAGQKRAIIFKREEDGSLDVAMEDPSDLRTIEFLERFLNARIKPFLAKPADIEKGFAVYNRRQAENFKKIIEESVKNSLRVKEDNIEKVAVAMPIVSVVENFISYAVSLRASDIHIETLEDSIIVRFRIDGILHEIVRIPKEVHASILARIKLLAGLKLDEHYKPQDGRFNYKIGEHKIDIRVAIMPTLYGEKIEMRLLPATQKPLALEEIGMLPDHIAQVKDGLEKSFGMVLVCGPTGSGKTTTLYSILNILNKPEINIVTIEDPIEYYIKYINQTQINSLAGVTFANALKAFLRQDPNVIMVGEVRDDETAEISVNAALTGHLVLSSLHTNTAAAAIPRMVDMKVPTFLISAVLNIAIAQRLVRKICLSCIESFKPTKEVVDILERQKKELKLSGDFKMPKMIFRGKGCSVCNNTGYQGRIGIFEILDVNEKIRSLINNSEFSLDKMEDLMAQENMITMFEDGIRKVELGMTTVEEVLRVIRE